MALPDIVIPVRTEGARSAKSDLDSFKEGLDSFTRGFNLVTSAAARALQVVGRALGVIGAAVREIGERGGTFGAVASYYQSIADPAMISRLQELSGWHIRQVEIMSSWNQVMSVGVVSAEEYAEWLQRITAWAQSNRQDPTRLWEQMREVLSGGGLEQLRKVGIEINAVRDAVRNAGVPFESLRGRTMALSEALSQLRETQGEVTNSAANLSDSWAAISTQSDDYLDRMSRVVSESPALLAAFEGLRERIFGVADTSQTMGEIVTNVMIAVANAVATAVARIFNELAGMAEGTETLIRAVLDSDIFREIADVMPGGEQLRSGLESLRDFSATFAFGWRSVRDDAREIAGILNTTPAIADPSTRTRRLPRRQLPGERGGGEEEDLLAGIGDPDYGRIWGDQAEMIRGYQEEEAAQELALHEARIRGAQERKEFERQAHEERLAQIEAEAEQAERLERQQQQRMTSMVKGTTDMVKGVSGIVRSVSAAYAQNIEDTEERKRAEGAFLVAYSSVMAAVELAESIAAFASQRYDQGAMHLVAMGEYIAAAAIAGSQLGGGSASAPAQRSYRPAETEAAARESDEPGERVTVINYSLGKVHGDLGGELSRASWERERQGIREQRPPGSRYR